MTRDKENVLWCNYKDAEFSSYDDKIYMILLNCSMMLLPLSLEKSPWLPALIKCDQIHNDQA
jgi:hypothetical protein